MRPKLDAAEAGQGHVFFVDAAHFVFGTFLRCLWSFTRIYVRAASGRQRFNVLGDMQRRDAGTDRRLSSRHRERQRQCLSRPTRRSDIDITLLVVASLICTRYWPPGCMGPLAREGGEDIRPATGAWQ